MKHQEKEADRSSSSVVQKVTRVPAGDGGGSFQLTFGGALEDRENLTMLVPGDIFLHLLMKYSSKSFERRISYSKIDT